MSRFRGHMISKHGYESVGMCHFFRNYRECKRCVDLTIRQSTIKRVKYLHSLNVMLILFYFFFTVNGNIEELLYTSEKTDVVRIELSMHVY